MAGMVAACSVVPAHAAPKDLRGPAMKVFRDYAPDARIDACKHASEDLREAQRTMPPDIEQYAPDYPAAVAAALHARARGDCTAPEPTPTPSPTPEPVIDALEVRDPPAPAAGAADSGLKDVDIQRVATAEAAADTPAPLIILGVLAGVLACFALLLVAMRRSRLGEERIERATHAWREASWRAGGAWEDFRDWLRLGR